MQSLITESLLASVVLPSTPHRALPNLGDSERPLDSGSAGGRVGLGPAMYLRRPDGSQLDVLLTVALGREMVNLLRGMVFPLLISLFPLLTDFAFFSQMFVQPKSALLAPPAMTLEFGPEFRGPSTETRTLQRKRATR